MELSNVGEEISKKPYEPILSQRVKASQVRASVEGASAILIENLRKENAKLRQDLTVFQMKNDVLTGLLMTIANSPFSTRVVYQDGRYDGQIVEGKRCGAGSFAFTDSSYYIGEWADDAFHGAGTFIDGSGTYEGSFQHGLRHGYGKQRYTNGGYLDGSWEHGQFVKGTGKSSNAYGVYEGGFQNSMRHGSGIQHFRDGEYKDGSWENDQFVKGKGKFPNAYGVYEGECLSDDMRHGFGIQYFPDGERFDGTWVNDKFEGGDYYRNARGVTQPRTP